MFNKKGFGIAEVVTIVLALNVAVITRGITETYYNGQLKTNACMIKCQFQNKGKDFCAERCDYTPLQDTARKIIP